MMVKIIRPLILAIIFTVISVLAIKTGEENPDWGAYTIAYESDLLGLELGYNLLSYVSRTVLDLDYSTFFFLQVFVNVVLIGYLIGSPLPALLGCVSLYFYIETNVGVQLRWGLAATVSLFALYATSRRTAGLVGLGAILLHVFAVIPLVVAFLVRCFERELARNTSIILSTCVAVLLMNYLDLVIYLIIPSDIRYLEYLDSEYSVYKSLSSTLYILGMFAMEVLMLNASAPSKLEKRSLVMVIYLRIAQIASLSFAVISGRLLLYSTLMEVLVIKSQLAGKNRALLPVYVLFSSAKVLALLP